jgi:hypothetical protein
MMFGGARYIGFWALALATVACGSDPQQTGKRSSPGSSEKPTGTSEQALDYTRIIEGSWTLAPGAENPNLCIQKPVTEDVYIHAIRPVHPPGTHHTLLTVGTADQECITAVASGFIYAAGVGSEGIVLPDGVALKLPAGSVLNLGLHIFNTGTTELSGTSAMEVVTMDAKDVVSVSDSVLAGPINFNLPAHQQTIVSDTCELTQDQSVYALFPHMHQLGTHIKTTVTASGVPTVLHDADYTFNEQYQLPLDPILKLSAGDSINTECTYDNTSDRDATFGESSTQEMCFSVLFRYPKQDTGICFGATPATTSAPL